MVRHPHNHGVDVLRLLLQHLPVVLMTLRILPVRIILVGQGVGIVPRIHIAITGHNIPGGLGVVGVAFIDAAHPHKSDAQLVALVLGVQDIGKGKSPGGKTGFCQEGTAVGPGCWRGNIKECNAVDCGIRRLLARLSGGPFCLSGISRQPHPCSFFPKAGYFPWFEIREIVHSIRADDIGRAGNRIPFQRLAIVGVQWHC